MYLTVELCFLIKKIDVCECGMVNRHSWFSQTNYQIARLREHKNKLSAERYATNKQIILISVFQDIL